MKQRGNVKPEDFVGVYKPKSRIISTQNVRTLEPPVCQEIIGPAQ